MDVELREDNTNPCNGYCADNFLTRHCIVQHDRLWYGKSLFAQELSYGKIRIGCTLSEEISSRSLCVQAQRVPYNIDSNYIVASAMLECRMELRYTGQHPKGR